MKIINETELMANQKASQIIVPDKQFDALQTIDGKSLLFSIGTDGVLFCSREVQGDTHGWVRVDLSSSLSASTYGGAAVVAKTFDIAQDLDPSINSIDIALVVTVNGKDYLHIAKRFTNTFDSWTHNAPSFTQYLFDDTNNATLNGLPINDVQIIDGNGSQYIIADIISDAQTQTISRYCIDTTKLVYNNQAWIPNTLPFDMQAGKITTSLGCGPVDGPNDTDTGGFYILGTVSNQTQPQLVYCPAYNAVNVNATAEPTVINIPESADASHMAIALSSANAPYTDLFFASNGSLYFLANADQVDTGTTKPTPTLIYTNSLFQNIQSIHVENWNNTIVLWGQSLSTDNSGTSQVFIMEGIAGQETNQAAWTSPTPLLFNVVNSATYINNNYGNNVIFTQQVVNNISTLTQLFEDPITTAWQQRSLLTAPDPENIQTVIYDTTTYSTHIEITDDSNIKQPNLPVLLWASSPCSVYISDASNNSAYFTLDTVTPVSLTSDFSGNVTIMQPVDTIGGISYYISVQDPVTKEYFNEAINPITGTITNLNSKVPDGGDHLATATVTDEQGNTKQLVNTSAYGSQTASTSANIHALCQNSSSLNPDGLAPGNKWPVPGSPLSAVKPALKTPLNAGRLAKNLRFNQPIGKIWGSTFSKNAGHYEGIEAMKAMGVTQNADGTLSLTLNSGKVLNSLDAIEVSAGNFFKWMQAEAHKVEALITNIINDEIDCLITLADGLYHFVLKCVSDVVNLVHSVLNAIETAFADIVAWIGMIFNFQDILRTHNVMNKIMTIYFNDCIDGIAGLSTDITNVFNNLESQIDKKTGLPTNGIPASSSTQTYQGGMATSTSPSGSKSPSANYGTHHLKNNAQNSDSSDTSASSFDETIFNTLLQLIQNEGEAFTTAADQIKAIASNIKTQSVGDTITQLMAVVVDLLLNTAENILQEMVNILVQLLKGVMDLITGSIQIPVLTYMYKKMTATKENPAGNDLTLLDVMCLVTSFFSTIVYKAVKGKAPFPEGALTDAILSATDITSLQQAIVNFDNASLNSTDKGLLGHGSDTGETVLNIITSVTAFVGAYIVDVCTFAKANLPNVPNPAKGDITANKFYTMFNSVGYWAYVAPDIASAVLTRNVKDQPWYITMNNVCTCLGVAKSMVDFTSWKWAGRTYGLFVGPALDFLLNVAWQVPTTAQLIVDLEGPKDTWVNSIVSCIGGTAFDLSGVLSPAMAYTYDLPANPDRTAALNILALDISVCNLVWGAGCLVTTFDQLPMPG